MDLGPHALRGLLAGLPMFAALPDDARAALDAARARGDRAAYALMLRLLGALVAEFNAPSPGRTLTQHR